MVFLSTLEQMKVLPVVKQRSVFFLGHHFYSVTVFASVSRGGVSSSTTKSRTISSFYRPYSTGVGKRKVHNVLGKILDNLFINNVNKQYISNETSQLGIENLVFNQYEQIFLDYKGYSVGGLNLYPLSDKLKSFIFGITKELKAKIVDLKDYYLNDSGTRRNTLDKAIAPIINELDIDFIYRVGLCLKTYTATKPLYIELSLKLYNIVWLFLVIDRSNYILVFIIRLISLRLLQKNFGY